MNGELIGLVLIFIGAIGMGVVFSFAVRSRRDDEPMGRNAKVEKLCGGSGWWLK